MTRAACTRPVHTGPVPGATGARSNRTPSSTTEKASHFMAPLLPQLEQLIWRIVQHYATRQPHRPAIVLLVPPILTGMLQEPVRPICPLCPPSLLCLRPCDGTRLRQPAPSEAASEWARTPVHTVHVFGVQTNPNQQSLRRTARAPQRFLGPPWSMAMQETGCLRNFTKCAHECARRPFNHTLSPAGDRQLAARESDFLLLAHAYGARNGTHSPAAAPHPGGQTHATRTPPAASPLWGRVHGQPLRRGCDAHANHVVAAPLPQVSLPCCTASSSSARWCTVSRRGRR